MADAALSHIPPALQSEGVSVTGSGGTAPVIPGTPVQPVVFEAVAVAVQPDKDWPDASKVDADKLSQARKIQPGYVPCHPKLTGFQPAKSKPGKNELWFAIMERDSSCRPASWAIEACVKKLLILPLGPTAHPEHSALPVVSSPPETDATAESAAAESDVQPESQKPRWSRAKTIRLLHCIHSKPGEFSSRDRRLNRQEMDAKGRNPFWHSMAQSFNSDEQFHILVCADDTARYAHFSAAPTSYIADADKLKTEFASLRTEYTKILLNFMKSGMGSGPDAEKVAEDPDAVHGSIFWDFCQGDAVIDYMHTLFTAAGIVDAATTEMPAGSGYSANKPRSCQSQPKPTAAGGTGRGKRPIAQDLKDILSSLPPLKFAKSARQQVCEQAHAMRQALKEQAGLEKLLANSTAKLDALAVEHHEALHETHDNATAAACTKKMLVLKKIITNINHTLRRLEDTLMATQDDDEVLDQVLDDQDEEVQEEEEEAQGGEEEEDDEN
jgi:hypothetical protein